MRYFPARVGLEVELLSHRLRLFLRFLIAVAKLLSRIGVPVNTPRHVTTTTITTTRTGNTAF